MNRRTARLIALGLAATLAVVAVALVGSSYLEHRRLVAQERAAFPAPGTRVEVGHGAAPNAPGLHLHVYAEGEGDPTLVFLAGHGTSAPYFDFSPLFERLSADTRIAVIERVGYGWSDLGPSPRDIDTVLRQTRAAIRQAGLSPPFVLVPHSLAGLEAVLWAQRHPGEIEAIVGLDPLVPGYVERSGEGASLSPLITLLARTGLMRSGPDVFETNFPAAVEGRLSAADMAAARAIFMRRTNTAAMWAEARALPGNAREVRTGGLPDVPVHAIVSGRQPDVWIEAIMAFTQATGGEAVLLDAGHYLHVERPGHVAERIRTLIEGDAGGRSRPGK